ncbi:hypothetical protein [Peribacillus sp. NPDC058075]|uniref:hypothetical protein n=1 Tax=unclassified Peribacillus TaxID=2675266 RepID=UPI0036DCFD9D
MEELLEMYELNAGLFTDDLWRITVGGIGPIGGIGRIGHITHIPVGIGGVGSIGDYGGIGISYGFPFAGGLTGGALLTEPYYGGYSGYGYPGYAPYPYSYSYDTY